MLEAREQQAQTHKPRGAQHESSLVSAGPLGQAQAGQGGEVPGHGQARTQWIAETDLSSEDQEIVEAFVVNQKSATQLSYTEQAKKLFDCGNGFGAACAGGQGGGEGGSGHPDLTSDFSSPIAEPSLVELLGAERYMRTAPSSSEHTSNPGRFCDARTGAVGATSETYSTHVA